MNPIKIAILGSGTMASIYARIISQRNDCQLVGFVGNTKVKAESIANAFGVPALADSDYARLFSEVKEIDAVIVATPEWVRLAPITAAVKRGCHLLLEKPFADSWSEAKQLEPLLRNYPNVISLCHVLRFSPRFAAMKTSVDRGAVGEVRHVFARRNSNKTRVSRVLGKTNLAFWLTPHDIDMILWVVPGKVRRVFASSRDKAKSADDYLVVMLQFDSNVTAVLEVSWCGPPVSGTSREAVFEVRGTGGNIEVSDFDMNVRIFSADQRVTAEDTYEDFVLHGQHRGYFFELIDDFVRKVKDGKHDSSELSKALEVTRICEMIRISLDEDRPVMSSEVA